MTRGPGVANATGDGLGETIGGMFDIPEMGLVEQAEDALTIGAEPSEPVEESQDDEEFNPLADFIG